MALSLSDQSSGKTERGSAGLSSTRNRRFMRILPAGDNTLAVSIIYLLSALGTLYS